MPTWLTLILNTKTPRQKPVGEGVVTPTAAGGVVGGEDGPTHGRRGSPARLGARRLQRGARLDQAPLGEPVAVPLDPAVHRQALRRHAEPMAALLVDVQLGRT